MSEILHFIRDLLRFGERMAARPPEPHRHDDALAYELRRPLYIGRGIVTLGGAPQRVHRGHLD